MTKKEKIYYFMASAFILITLVSSLLASPFFEAKSFKKITGKDVSTWDAIWLELRVDGCLED